MISTSRTHVQCLLSSSFVAANTERASHTFTEKHLFKMWSVSRVTLPNDKRTLSHLALVSVLVGTAVVSTALRIPWKYILLKKYDLWKVREACRLTRVSRTLSLAKGTQLLNFLNLIFQCGDQHRFVFTFTVLGWRQKSQWLKKINSMVRHFQRQQWKVNKCI